MEVFVLTELGKRGGRHFCKIEDKGRFGSFNYVVMTLVGKSLQDLRKEGPGGHMSLGTALSCGLQALEALEDLHGIGYLHRYRMLYLSLFSLSLSLSLFLFF